MSRDDVIHADTDEPVDETTDDTAEDDAVDDASDDAPDEQPRAPRRPDRVVVAGVVLALALATYAIVLGLGDDGDTDRTPPRSGLAAMFADDRAVSAVTTASDQVEGLLTLDPATVDQTLETLAARTTGDFRRQFEALVQTFGTVVRQGKVSTKGEINSAGLIDLADDRANVLVASSAAVSNSQTKTPTPRSYRMKVGLQWVEGAWLVSGIEFVGGKGQEKP